MLLKCPTCATECTVADDSHQTVSCPHCGRTLFSGTDPLAELTGDTAREETRLWTSPPPDALAGDESLPCRIGRYLVTSAIARGGYSRVFLANDEELDRPVALKLPRADRYASHEKLDAVLDEARTAAKLRHPGIVTIYDVGYLQPDSPFIAMEFVSGQSLRGLMSHGRLPVARVAELTASIAEAAHYAHGQGLVHRDLKPGNVLIDERGQPKIVDFGLAVHESRQSRLDGDVSGTPAYMAPEQVRGDAHRLDGRTDVWSLGVILYEMLTGRRPFTGQTAQLFDEIQHRDPRPPRQIDDGIPRQLEEICLRCLSKPMTARYSTSLDLAQALRGWLQSSLSPVHPAGATTLDMAGQLTESSSRRVAPVETRETARAKWIVGGGLCAALCATLGLGLLAGSGALSRLPSVNSGKASAKEGAPLVERRQRPPLATNRLTPLLDREPEILVWPKAAADSYSSFNEELQQLVLNGSHPGAVTLAEVESSTYRVEVRLSKSQWVGGEAGILWGVAPGTAQDGTPSVRFQVVLFHGFDIDGTPQFRIERALLESWQPAFGLYPAWRREDISSEVVDPPQSPEILFEIVLREGALVEVRWQGRHVDGVADRAGLAPPRPLASQGPLGLYNSGGTTIFRNAQIQVFDSNPTSPESDKK